jgi:hypothetical protein
LIWLQSFREKARERVKLKRKRCGIQEERMVQDIGSRREIEIGKESEGKRGEVRGISEKITDGGAKREEKREKTEETKKQKRENKRKKRKRSDFSWLFNPIITSHLFPSSKFLHLHCISIIENPSRWICNILTRS